MNAPIALFVYNRPQHTKRLLESLRSNSLSNKSDLYIFADGPKVGATKEQLDNLNETRKIIRSDKWCKKVTIIERKKNMGLAKSVIAGVTQIINKYGKIIVLEDDLVLSPHFLEYMNQALNKYNNNTRVMQISGFMFPVETKTDSDSVFLPITCSWGWGTWKRCWDKFDVDMLGYDKLSKSLKLRKKFDLNGSYPYFAMLKNQKQGRNDSWAIRFYLSVFMRKGLVLFPSKTLVRNAGFGRSAVHTKIGIHQENISDTFIVKSFPPKVASNYNVLRGVSEYLLKQNSLLVKILSVIGINL